MFCTRFSAAVVALGLLSGCGTDTPAAAPTSTTAGSPRALALPSTPVRVPMAEGTALAPDGWSKTPPNLVQVNDMSVWMKSHIDGGGELLGSVLTTIDAMNAAVDKGDIRGAKDSCNDVAQQLATRIPKALPTPDPDMTAALQSVIDAGHALSARCAALTNPPPADAAHEVDQAMGHLGAALAVIANVVQRDAVVIVSNKR